MLLQSPDPCIDFSPYQALEKKLEVACNIAEKYLCFHQQLQLVDQELSLNELEDVNGAFWQRISLRFTRKNGKKAVVFYPGLAGVLAGGADYEKAAHEAGKMPVLLTPVAQMS